MVEMSIKSSKSNKKVLIGKSREGLNRGSDRIDGNIYEERDRLGKHEV